ncbi:hypothetical protein C2E23DRAFT_889920 [Lenzites betulinus]|nr:hypothetical protein C2E23DRAFT_889920 [Lenzites betulinus]
MAPDFEKEWDRLAEVERENRTARQLRRTNLAAYKHSVELVVWLKDGQPPDIWDLQGIAGFPMLNFAQQSDHHLARLQMDCLGKYEQWVPRATSWRVTNVDHILKVRSRQKILLRKDGVKHCIQFNDIVKTVDDPLSVFSPSPLLVSLTPGRKRAAEESLLDERHHAIARHGASHRSPAVPSHVSPHRTAHSLWGRTRSTLSPSAMSEATTPPSSLSSPGSMSSLPSFTDLFTTYISDPLHVADSHPNHVSDPLGLGLDLCSATVSLSAVHGTSPQSLPTSNNQPALDNTLDLVLAQIPSLQAGPSTLPLSPSPPEHVYDALWENGRVYLPPAVTQSSWPDGLYARDVAKAFELIYADKAVPVRTQFETIFGSGRYVHTTYSRNLCAWRASGEEERERIRSLPRTASGLWVVAREALSGWQARPAHRRKDEKCR